MTTYKLQSLSLDHVIIDFQSCSGSESPYVMASQVKSLDGLMILRPFRQSKICCPLQQDVRDELKQQHLLELSMLAQHGEGEIAVRATADLNRLRLHKVLLTENVPLDLDNSNVNTLIQWEHHVSDQISRYTEPSCPANKCSTAEAGPVPK